MAGQTWEEQESDGKTGIWGSFGVVGTDNKGDLIITTAVVQPEKDSLMTTIIPVEYPTQEDLDRLALLDVEHKRSLKRRKLAAVVVLPILLSVIVLGYASLGLVEGTLFALGLLILVPPFVAFAGMLITPFVFLGSLYINSTVRYVQIFLPKDAR
jgi:hypothetical protein